MKFTKFWSWIKSLFKHQKSDKVFIPDNDIYGMIKHETKSRYSLGSRSMRAHNNRKTTKGRHVQYVMGENGITKPIYHLGY
jgi:hypothetical protein